MKTRMLLLLPATCLLATVAWFVHGQSTVPVNDVPEKYRETVQKGLEYVVANQHKDGHWEGDDGKHPVAMTALVGLALLMERNRPLERDIGLQPVARSSKHSANLRTAADWLMSKSKPERDGLIFSEHPSETSRYMQGHGLATLFLAGACEEEKDDARRKKLTDAVARAVKYIVNAQSTQGGWHDTSKTEGHDFATIPATVIQIQALQAAENAGIPVSGEALHDAREYLKMMLGKSEAESKAKPNRSRPEDTAAALACLANAGRVFVNGRGASDEPKDELHKKWFKYCESEIPVGPDIKLGRDQLAHYYLAQAQFNRGGVAWNGYRTALFDPLQSSQNKDGGWPAGNGISVGPVYSTAVWCIVLQLDKRSHPSTRRIEIRVTTDNGRRPRLLGPGSRFAMTLVGESKA